MSILGDFANGFVRKTIAIWILAIFVNIAIGQIWIAFLLPVLLISFNVIAFAIWGVGKRMTQLTNETCIEWGKVIADPKKWLESRLGRDIGNYVTRTRLFVLALFIVLHLNFFLDLMDIQFGIGLGRFSFVITTTVLLYALSTRIAEKLRQK